MSAHNGGGPPDSTPPAHIRHLEERLSTVEDRVGSNFMTTNSQVGELAFILLRFEAKLDMVIRLLEERNER